MPTELKTELISTNIANKTMEKMFQAGTITQGSALQNVRYLSFPVAFGAVPRISFTAIKGTVQKSKIASTTAASFSIMSVGTPFYNPRVFNWIAWGSV
jgi:hypothetical protein